MKFSLYTFALVSLMCRAQESTQSKPLQPTLTQTQTQNADESRVKNMEQKRHEQYVENAQKANDDRLKTIDESTTLTSGEKKELTDRSAEYLDLEKKFSENRLNLMSLMFKTHGPGSKASQSDTTDVANLRNEDHKFRERLSELKKLFDATFSLKTDNTLKESATKDTQVMTPDLSNLGEGIYRRLDSTTVTAGPSLPLLGDI